jgi:hypothetical protein
MNCPDIQENLALYADGSLEGPKERQVREHLKDCVSCREELGAFRAMLNLVQAVPEPPVPSGLHWHIMKGIQAERRRAKRKKAGAWFGLPRALTAAAAAFLLFFAGGNYYLAIPLTTMSPAYSDSDSRAEINKGQKGTDLAADPDAAATQPEAPPGEDSSRNGILPAPAGRPPLNPVRNLVFFNGGLFALGGGFWYYYRRKTHYAEETGD